jgi:hypothetical protein
MLTVFSPVAFILMILLPATAFANVWVRLETRRFDAFASAPSASSAAVDRAPAGEIGTTGVVADIHGPVAPEVVLTRGPWSLTLLTVQTVFSRVARILINLLPARPSRLNVSSMPNARRYVCARRDAGGQ